MNRPAGFRSASKGTRRLMRSKSSMESLIPISWAIASRCNTAFVEPPEAHTLAMEFSRASRVMMALGRKSRRYSSNTFAPADRATSFLPSQAAGTLALPMGEIPRNSQAIAMVLAVNCPPGHALSSRHARSLSLMRPRACAPTASKTSCMETFFP